MEKLINNAPFALVLVFLVIGFVLLIKGADFFVEGSSSVAKRLHVPSIIIGLTIVAMGTSLRSEERRVGKECRSRWSPYH